MAVVQKIDATAHPRIRRKRVAAYARVSMDTDRLQHSLAAQVSHYSELIQRNPEWIYAGVYADNAITGTKASSRAELNRLLADCEAGRIDMILTKSISRFARNTVDLLQMVRHLKELGIAVYFEKERINSLTEDGELMLTLLASFAQEESRSISENIKWATTKRFKEGIPNGHFTIYGYEWQDERLVIIPEEAEVIRFMYSEYMKGASRIEIGRALMSRGIYTRKGKQWSDSNVKKILTNITYTGNFLFQKEYCVDPISKRTKINRGELPQYFVEDTHEAIIPMEEWQAVQAEIKRRRELGPFGNKSLNTTCFTGKIKCPYCGVSYMRITSHDGASYWVCGSKKKKGSKCPVKGLISKPVLKKATAEVLELPEFDEAAFLDQIDHIDVPEARVLVYYLMDGRTITHHWEYTSKKDEWTPERRSAWSERYKRKDTSPKKAYCYPFTGFIRCGYCGANYRSNASTLSDGSTMRHWRCSGSRAECKNKSIKDDTMRQLVIEVLGLDAFDEAAMDEQIEYASILDGNVTFHFRDGNIITKPYHDRRTDAKQTEGRMTCMAAEMPAK